MTTVDSFKIVQGLQGTHGTIRIEVRPFSYKGPNYPSEFIQGKVYDLRLLPSEKTKEQLREARKTEISFIWVDAKELQFLSK